MSMERRAREGLARRLVAAALGVGVGVVACRGKDHGAEVVKEPDQPGATRKATPGEQATGSAEPPRAACTAELKEMCVAPFTNARATGTGEPGPAPPASAFDGNGCLPREMVTSGCCNPALDGPRFADGKCCYRFCPGLCCGRPLVVGGRGRVAGLWRTRGWVDQNSV